MGCLIFQLLRDGKWKEEDAAVLVPGDIISIKLGDIIPADARLLQGDPLKIDQACDQRMLLLHLHMLSSRVNTYINSFFSDINKKKLLI